jgi:hypothetical protein
MLLVSDCKLKYKGVIRRAGVPFEVEDGDVDILINEWKCRYLHKPKQPQESKPEPEQAEQVERSDQASEPEKQQKKTRKRKA